MLALANCLQIHNEQQMVHIICLYTPVTESLDGAGGAPQPHRILPIVLGSTLRAAIPSQTSSVYGIENTANPKIGNTFSLLYTWPPHLLGQNYSKKKERKRKRIHVFSVYIDFIPSHPSSVQCNKCLHGRHRVR